MVARLKHGLWARVVPARMRSYLGEQLAGVGGALWWARLANGLVLLDELLHLRQEEC